MMNKVKLSTWELVLASFAFSLLAFYIYTSNFRGNQIDRIVDDSKEYGTMNFEKTPEDIEGDRVNQAREEIESNLRLRKGGERKIKWRFGLHPTSYTAGDPQIIETEEGVTFLVKRPANNHPGVAVYLIRFICDGTSIIIPKDITGAYDYGFLVDEGVYSYDTLRNICSDGINSRETLGFILRYYGRYQCNWCG